MYIERNDVGNKFLIYLQPCVLDLNFSFPKKVKFKPKKLDISRFGHQTLFSLYMKTCLYSVKFNKLSFKHGLHINFLN